MAGTLLCLVIQSCPGHLSLAKTHGAWLQDLMKLRFMMPHCKKFSERHSEVRGRFVWIQREAHSTGCKPLQRVSSVAMEYDVVSFCELGDFIC